MAPLGWWEALGEGGYGLNHLIWGVSILYVS